MPHDSILCSIIRLPALWKVCIRFCSLQMAFRSSSFITNCIHLIGAYLKSQHDNWLTRLLISAILLYRRYFVSIGIGIAHTLCHGIVSISAESFLYKIYRLFHRYFSYGKFPFTSNAHVAAEFEQQRKSTFFLPAALNRYLPTSCWIFERFSRVCQNKQLVSYFHF